MRNDIEAVLISREEVAATVKRLGAELSRDYAGKTPIMIAVLKGAFVFMSDLVREVTVPCTLDFMAVSSYGSGMVRQKNIECATPAAAI